jgi:hypothetical protein
MALVNFRKNVDSFPSIFARIPMFEHFRVNEHTQNQFFLGSYQQIFFLQNVHLKVHKNENFFGFDFEFCPISLLVMHK